jgi:hypothetical protein
MLQEYKETTLTNGCLIFNQASNMLLNVSWANAASRALSLHGTKLPNRDVRYTGACGEKADIAGTARFGSV